MTRPELSSEMATAAAVKHSEPAVVDWLLVALLSVLAGVIGVFGVFFLPMYIGSFPAPVSALLVGATLAVIPRMGYRLTGRMVAALAPAVVWFLVTVGLYLTDNALYTGVPVAWRGWQFALLVGIGGVAAASSVGLVWGDHLSVGPAVAVSTDRRGG